MSVDPPVAVGVAVCGCLVPDGGAVAVGDAPCGEAALSVNSPHLLAANVVITTTIAA
ncbi:hypothetical protein GCM10009765_69840 [Fodinicola feengrottensis]|uniref:Uncharacterized protein n=2 Tax=Fodinicola feengrottensis TaxID=435914 RepID=A0ABP4URG7_9ACTN